MLRTQRSTARPGCTSTLFNGASGRDRCAQPRASFTIATVLSRGPVVTARDLDNKAGHRSTRAGKGDWCARREQRESESRRSAILHFRALVSSLLWAAALPTITVRSRMVDSARRRVLIVDDEPLVSEVLSEHFE